MAGTHPEKLILDYGGGDTVSVDFASLPLPLQAELLRQPFAVRPRLDSAAERFLLLEWKDGWKEVYRVDDSCTAINRYYVISRVEEVGRLSLHTASGYPLLLEIDRRPAGVERITFGDTYAVEPAGSTREGKKTEHWFSLESMGDGAAALQAAARLAAAGGTTRVVAGWCGHDLVDFLEAMGVER